MSLVVVDCPDPSPGPRMQVAGMTVVERLVREALREGHAVVVRCSDDVDASLTPLREQLGIELERWPLTAPLPDGATRVSASELLGVELENERARRRAEWRLMETCRRPYDGLSDRYLWRHLSLRITRHLTRWPVRPNGVTFVATCLGLGACALLVWRGDDRAMLAVAGLAILLSLVLDSVDGELARVRHMGSRAGMWFDNVSDDVIDTLLLAAMGVAVGDFWVPFSLAIAGLRAFAAIVIYAGAARLGHPGDVMAFRWWFESDQETTEVYQKLTPLLLVRSFGRRDTYVTVFAICFLAGFPLGALLLGAANAVGHGVLALLHLFLARAQRA